MAKEQTCNDGIGVLAGPITSSDTTLTLVSLVGLPASVPFNVRIEDEILRVTAKDAPSKTYTITRGAEGTTAAAHAENLNVFHPLTLAGLKRWNAQLLSGTEVAHQRGLNFIPSDGVTIDLAEDAANENCDVTIGNVPFVLGSGSQTFTLTAVLTGLQWDVDITGFDLQGRTVTGITPIVRVATVADGTVSATANHVWTVTNVWLYRIDGTTSGLPERLAVGAAKVGGTVTDGDILHMYYSLIANG